MANFAATLREDMLKWALNIGTIPTRPTVFYVSFHTADPEGTGANETSYLTRTLHNSWDAGTTGDGIVENTGAGETASATGAATITHFGVWSAATNGTFYFGGALTESKIIALNDKLSWADAALTAILS